MAITTSISKSYLRWMLIFAISCLVIGLWGVYDYMVKLPAQQEQYDRFLEVQLEFDELIQLKEQRDRAGLSMTSDEFTRYESLELELNVLAPGGEKPKVPSKFDWVFQWLCIFSLPWFPYFLWLIAKAKKQVYRLDDEGALHLPKPENETWPAKDIVDIDMSKWMKKSIAQVVHTDGRKTKLDDYIHQDMFKIVGEIAQRFHPDQWDIEAKLIKKGKASAKDTTEECSEAENAPAGGEIESEAQADPDS